MITLNTQLHAQHFLFKKSMALLFVMALWNTVVLQAQAVGIHGDVFVDSDATLAIVSYHASSMHKKQYNIICLNYKAT